MKEARRRKEQEEKEQMKDETRHSWREEERMQQALPDNGRSGSEDIHRKEETVWRRDYLLREQDVLEEARERMKDRNVRMHVCRPRCLSSSGIKNLIIYPLCVRV